MTDNVFIIDFPSLVRLPKSEQKRAVAVIAQRMREMEREDKKIKETEE